MLENKFVLAIVALTCMAAAIALIVFGIKLLRHCLREYRGSMLSVLHPVHIITYVPVLVGVFANDELAKYLPSLSQKLEKYLIVFILLAIGSVVHRIFRNTSYISIFTNIGCLFFEMVMSFLVILCVIAIYAIIMLIGAIFLIGLFGADAAYSSGGGEGNSDVVRRHVLKKGLLGTDLIYVYSINGNMSFLHGYDGTLYTEIGDRYTSDDDDEVVFYYLTRYL